MTLTLKRRWFYRCQHGEREVRWLPAALIRTRFPVLARAQMVVPDVLAGRFDPVACSRIRRLAGIYPGLAVDMTNYLKTSMKVDVPDQDGHALAVHWKK